MKGSKETKLKKKINKNQSRHNEKKKKRDKKPGKHNTHVFGCIQKHVEIMEG